MAIKGNIITRKLPRKLFWGVAGCGKFTELTFLPTFQQLKRSKLISVYSRKLNRAKIIADEFSAENASNDFDEFLQGDFDALYIGSENRDHYEQVIKAAKAGKNIFCEKPLAINSGQAEEMVRVCRENNVWLAVDYPHQFHPIAAKAKELIKSGIIGKIVTVNVSFNIDFAPDTNFRFDKNKSGGGALRDLGSHMINLLSFFGGTITEIDGWLDNIIYNSQVEDFAIGIVKFSKSGYGYFNVSFNIRQPVNRIEIIGYNGNLIIEHIIGRKGIPGKLIIDLPYEAKKAFRKRANKLLYTLRSVQSSFLKNEEPQITGEDGLINMRLMEQLEMKCAQKKNL